MPGALIPPFPSLTLQDYLVLPTASQQQLSSIQKS